LPLFEIGPDGPTTVMARWATGAARVPDVKQPDYTACPNCNRAVENTPLVQALNKRLITIGPEYRRMVWWKCPHC
jgi:hypothetical protein